MNNDSSIKAEMVLSRVGNFSSEKIVNVSNNNRLKIGVCPKQQNPSSSSSSNAAPFDRQAQFLVQNHANFRKSAEPGRVMFYDTDGSWVDYPEEVLSSVKCGFREGKAMVEVSLEGRLCLFDFYRMLEIEFDSGHERSIAWIDVNGQCFFPKAFVNSSVDGCDCDENAGFEGFVGDNPQKISIEVKIVGDFDNQENLYKRKRECEDIEVDQVVKGQPEMSSSDVRNHGAKKHKGSGMEAAKWPKTKVLREGDKEYGIVKGLFLSWLGRVEPGATITRIHQCTRNGPLEKARYATFTEHIEYVKKTRGDSNTVFAWYGTSAKGVECILARGFGMPDEVRRPQPHGVGVYLSPIKSPHTSTMFSEVDDNGEKHVILCRVILGKSEKVMSPNQMWPSSPDFDSGVDDLANPKWYVVWHNNVDTCILPEVVVSFRGANHVQGQANGISTVKSAVKSATPALGVTIPELISKLAKSLPSPKVKELLTLSGSWKDGKLGKDMFMQQLRSVVGDEKLREVIHEIRG
ncbi:OLC1v1017094C1 [Oldenlandia corymbosa var. corymbosa]|uniref:OLC1v1017094C1 n=1 Tax=Oldenlandia corymbosa var. corymbosa TaxID=529605 RepID=A0AAV1E8M6_OLDCO|nr:OLC1v1017094C1 [Oldenlandia corymbosa var. corymbosa]